MAGMATGSWATFFSVDWQQELWIPPFCREVEPQACEKPCSSIILTLPCPTSPGFWTRYMWNVRGPHLPLNGWHVKHLQTTCGHERITCPKTSTAPGSWSSSPLLTLLFPLPCVTETLSLLTVSQHPCLKYLPVGQPFLRSCNMQRTCSTNRESPSPVHSAKALPALPQDHQLISLHLPNS